MRVTAVITVDYDESSVDGNNPAADIEHAIQRAIGEGMLDHGIVDGYRIETIDRILTPREQEELNRIMGI